MSKRAQNVCIRADSHKNYTTIWASVDVGNGWAALAGFDLSLFDARGCWQSTDTNRDIILPAKNIFPVT